MMYSKCSSDIIKLISMNYHNTGTITLLRRLTANKKIFHFEWRKKVPVYSVWVCSVNKLFLSLLLYKLPEVFPSNRCTATSALDKMKH
jgi:hypothetical protein